MCFTINKKGFTLFEILVALAVSSIIIIGLFEIFKTVIDARTFSNKRNQNMEIVSKTISVINSDIRCKIGNFRVQTIFGVTKLEFTTTHSLLFGGSVPVDVSYYIDTQNGGHKLIREEKNEAAGEDLSIPLTDKFRNIEFKFYFHGDWSDTPSQIIRITLQTLTKNRYSFVARGVLGE